MDNWQTKFQKGSEEFLFFQELYTLLQSFWNVNDVKREEWTEYWKQLKKQTGELRIKYNNTPLARNFTDAMLYTMVDKSVGEEHDCKVVLDLKFVEEGNTNG